MSQGTDVIQKLKDAVAGLYWMSESDFPFQVVKWSMPGLTVPDLLTYLDRPPEIVVKTITVNDWFQRAIEPQTWHNVEEAATVRRYQQLLTLLESQLTELQVFKLSAGAGIFDIYILGCIEPGWVAGLVTQVVET